MRGKTGRRHAFLALTAGLATVFVAATAGTARADSYQTITPYRFPTACGSFGGSTTVSAAESGGLPVRLKFGWGALQTQQLDKFLAVQNGTITVTAPDGSVVFHDQWATGDATGWSPYYQTPLTANGTTFVQGWATRRFEDIGPLSNPNPGTDATYHLSMDLELTKAVNDGFGAYSPGAWIQLTDCPLVVRNYGS